MKVVIYVGLGHTSGWLSAAAEGFRKHGLKPALLAGQETVGCDLAVTWGYRKARVIARQKADGNDHLVLERGYFGDRFKMTSCGFNGLNRAAEFYNKGMPGDRWKKHKVHVSEWRTGGEGVIIGGQVQGDMSVAGMQLGRLYNGLREDIRRVFSANDLDWPIKFKPHPLAKGKCTPSGCEEVSSLDTARWLVCYNSNLLTEATLLGIPCIGLDEKAMAWPVIEHDLEALAQPFVPKSRKQWLYDLAYTQWSEGEIKRGAMWEHLKQRYA